MSNVKTHTVAGDRRKALQKAVRAPAACQEAQRLQGEADAALAEAESLKLQARREDLNVWQMKKAKAGKKGTQIYTYKMTSWREGEKTRNMHPGFNASISQTFVSKRNQS